MLFYRRLLLSFHGVVLLPLAVAGFSIPSHHAAIGPVAAMMKTVTTTTSLNVGTVLQETEDEARYWLHRAQDCAFSTGRFCSVEEAQECLNEIIDIESACTMGTMVAHDVCDVERQTMLPEIVGRLRDRVDGEVSAIGVLASSSSLSSRQEKETEERTKRAFGSMLLLAITWVVCSWWGADSKQQMMWVSPKRAEALFPKGFL